MALQLYQHSWQAEVGALDASDATGQSEQTAPILADITFQGAGIVPYPSKVRYTHHHHGCLNSTLTILLL